MIPQEELTRTADRLTDALTAAAEIMTPGPPGPAPALASQVPAGTAAFPAPRPGRDRAGGKQAGQTRREQTGRLRGWLVPVGAAVSVIAVVAIIATSVALVGGHPGTGPTGPTRPAPAGVPSGPGTPAFYVTIVSMGINREGHQLLSAQVRRTSDGQLTGTMPALPADLTLDWGVSATADDRTFTVAAETTTVCSSRTPPPTQTRFYQFDVTSTGQVTGLRAVGQPVTGEAVSEFAASPDGTEVAYAEQGCAGPASAAMNTGVINVMDLTSGAVRSWHSTASAATPARVTTQIGAMSWTANGRTLIADYQWKVVESPYDLAVLALDTTSSGGSLQAHSHLLFSQGGRCTVCVYTALISSDGSTLTEVVLSPASSSRSNPSGGTLYRESVLQLSLITGKPSGILYTSAPFAGGYEGLVPVLSGNGQAQDWFLVQDPSDFGWISGGKLVPLPIKASAGLMAINW
jgi:hypothetical protein